MKNTRLALAAIILGSSVLAGIAGCSSRATQVSREEGEVTRKVIGPEGGTLTARGLVLVIPSGALPSSQELSVRVTTSAPGVNGALSPVYRFEPSGLTFARPVLVELTADGVEHGSLFWSRAGDESSFEPIGIVTAGKGRALAMHFSSAFAGASSCPTPSPGAGDAGGACFCKATDGQGDALCATDPNGTATPSSCPDVSFSGTNGGSCSGYGFRSAEKFLCACRASNGDFLCPKPFILNPQSCPSEHGLDSFEGMEKQGCSGYTVLTNANSGEPYNQGMSGSMEGCQRDGMKDKFISVSGVLECPDGGSGIGTGGSDAGAADAGPPTPPGEDPVMKEPPGDCADADGGATAEYDGLYKGVEDECKTKPSSCKGLSGSKDGPEVEKRWQQAFSCYDARLTLMQKCFRGGDDKHHKQLAQVQNNMTNCQEAACR